jgi:hypothetical protein
MIPVIYYLLIVFGQLIYFGQIAYYGRQDLISLLIIYIWMLIVLLIYLFFNRKEVSKNIVEYLKKNLFYYHYQFLYFQQSTF